MVAAVVTGIAFAVTDSVVARANYTALRTGRYVAIAKIKHVIEAGIIVWKLQMESIYCVAL